MLLAKSTSTSQTKPSKKPTSITLTKISFNLNIFNSLRPFELFKLTEINTVRLYLWARSSCFSLPRPLNVFGLIFLICMNDKLRVSRFDRFWNESISVIHWFRNMSILFKVFSKPLNKHLSICSSRLKEKSIIFRLFRPLSLIDIGSIESRFKLRILRLCLSLIFSLRRIVLADLLVLEAVKRLEASIVSLINSFEACWESSVKLKLIFSNAWFGKKIHKNHKEKFLWNV